MLNKGYMNELQQEREKMLLQWEICIRILNDGLGIVSDGLEESAKNCLVKAVFHPSLVFHGLFVLHEISSVRKRVKQDNNFQLLILATFCSEQ